ncbi:polyadenylate-binding protein 3-like [Triticum dicoccoides]|uniref:polyadenylate-binding protein 3-like n=1 Tax=Triticum dicoccoides TaxID=85692 RepID=UPI00188EDADA|nr:polyadenylate-binding protein 3-like [Triticum dicoccoides]
MAGRPLLAPAVTLRPPGPALGSWASLYVGDLDDGVVEGHLYALFCKVGPVASLRICRDVTGRSLGYAYVIFYSREDAKHALDSLNFTPANGKHIRVMFSNRDPTLRLSGKANIFIKNLVPNIDGKSLSDMFGQYGTILSCKVATHFNGQSKGYGFVQFADETSANDAIDSLNGKLVNGKRIFVGLFIRRQERQPNISLSNYTNVYVKNLPKEFTHNDLLQEFGPFGTITSAVIMRDNDGISKCFGFVNYGESECAVEAVKILNGKMIKDTILYVGRAQKKSEREAELKENFECARNEKFKKFEGLNLYVKNLDDSINDLNLGGLFEVFGEIGSCKVMVDSQGRSKGYGFVSFTTIEAIDGMNRKIVGKKPLYVGVAQRKEERRAMLVNTGVLAPAVPQNFAPRQFYVGPGVPGMFPPQMVYPNTNQAFTYMPNSMNVNANSVMVPPGFAQTDSTVSTPSVPRKNTTTTAVDSSYLEKQHPLEPELGGKVTGILGEAMEALQGRKLEEARDTVDLATIPSSSTLSVSRDAIDPASTASSSSASADGANLAPSPSSSSA